MYNYNTSERTVTLTYDEYAELVNDAEKYHLLLTAGVGSWEEYGPTMQLFDSERYGLSMQQLDLLALQLMEDEDQDDYVLGVACQWLHLRCQATQHRTAQWYLNMSDLVDELRRIHDGLNK